VKPLLLLIDLQRDYLGAAGLDPPAGAVVERAGTLLSACRERGVPVVHVWTTVSRSDDRRMPHWKREDRWLCEEGTAGHAPPPELEPEQGELVLHKTFFRAFEGEDLERVLRAERADPVLLAGVHLHGCVRQAVLDAYQRHRGDLWVAEDATTSDDPVHSVISRRYLERRAARFLSVAGILAGLRGAPPPSENGDAAGRAAGRCRNALPAWQRTEVGERAAALERLAERLEPEAARLADAMAVGIGKPVSYGSLEVVRTAEMLRAVGRHACAEIGAEASGRAEIRRRPVGVVLAVTPWNNPIYIPLGKIGPALSYGNAVVWKPAPAAQDISERLAGLLDGLPVTLVAGGRRAGEAAMADRNVDAVTLTGSSRAGFTAQGVCARRRVPLQAELGGNNAAVVWPDADLELAAREIAEGAFALAGQRCTANRRLIVHRDCQREMLQLVGRETAALGWGDPRRPQTKVGPLVSAAQRDRVADLVARAGADVTVILPHADDAPAADGFEGAWYPPTIACCPDPSHELVQHESFGPLLVVQTADDWNHAMALLDGVPQGLVAALFSSSRELAERFLQEARAGILKLNRSTADAEVDVPFGGWKGSGIGPPEHGSFDRDFYTRPQAVYGWPRAVAASPST
jgi:alpha-ketoglutaric semialdehyde dehydrogenase